MMRLKTSETSETGFLNVLCQGDRKRKNYAKFLPGARRREEGSGGGGAAELLIGHGMGSGGKARVLPRDAALSELPANCEGGAGTASLERGAPALLLCAA